MHTGWRQAAARLIDRHAGAALALGVRILAAAMAYLLQILLARTLGAAEFGTFSFAWSLITLSGFLATLGFGQIAVRFLARYHERGEFSLARGFLRFGLAMTLLGSGTVATLLLLMLPLFERGYGIGCRDVLAIGVFCLPFFALTDYVEGMARSQGWTFRALAPPYLLRQGVIIAIILFALWSGKSIGALFAMSAALGATILAAIAQCLLTVPALLRILPPASPVYDAPAWRKAAGPTLLADFAMLSRQNIDLILLALLAPPTSVGLYFAATRIASLLGLIEFAVSATYGHRFARAIEGGNAPFLGSVYRSARMLTALPGGVAAIGLMLACPVILSLFGAEFQAAKAPTLILLGAATLRLLVGPIEDALSMGGHPDAPWRANLIGTLVVLIGCLLLCREYQATGAAIASALGTVAAMLSMAFALRRQLGVSLFGLFRKA